MRRALLHAVACVVLALVPAAGVRAQGADPLAGMGTNTKDPIQIESDALTILDKDKKAVFSGNVNVVQGEMTMKAQTLVVFYTGGPATPGAPATPAGAGGSQISRIEAEGAVSLRQKDQTASGQKAVYDAAEQKVRLTGNVVLSQGTNVVQGDALEVDLRTRASRIIGRPKGLFIPAQGKGGEAPKPDVPRPEASRR